MAGQEHKCDWCRRPAEWVYPVRGYPEFGSDGCFLRACRAHAGVAAVAASRTPLPDPPRVPVRSPALFDKIEYGKAA